MDPLKITLKRDEKNTFCVLPWTHICVSTSEQVIPCCRFQAPKPNINISALNEKGIDALNTPEYNAIRSSMLEGKKVEQCKKCYFEEDNNISSYRDYSKNWFFKPGDKFEDNKFKEIRYIELSLDNICNLQCRMCSSRFSSKLILRDQELSKHSWNKNDYKVYKKLEIDYSFLLKEDLSKLEEIKLLGGEPFMSPNFNKFIDFLIEKTNYQNIRLFLVTNGTHKLSQEIVNKLNKFKLIKLRVSFDTYSKANDYQRYGSSYLDIWNNLIEYYNIFPSAEIGVHSVISTYNANMLGVSFEQYKKYDINYRLDFVRNQEMSLSYVPDDFADWLRQQNKENETASSYINSVLDKREKNPSRWEMFLKNTKLLDTYYNISLKDYNPNLYEFLNKNYEYN